MAGRTMDKTRKSTAHLATIGESISSSQPRRENHKEAHLVGFSSCS
jgi:hypothetical protein